MAETAKPRLRKLDELFEMNGGVNPLVSPTPIIEAQSAYKRIVYSIAVDDLTPFRKRQFRLYEDERLDDMVASIRANGVLIPIIVRRVDDLLEILSGHNRVNAATLAGLDKVPTLILENISDEDAMVYVIETNLLQRSFSDMAHSEKAAVLVLHHSKMFSQGKRNDILEQIKMLENPDGCKDDGTCAQVEHKLKSRDKVAKEYGLERNTVARYLRINKLISALKTLLDNGDIAFIAGYALSYLQEAEQALLVECMEQTGLTIDIKKAEMLRMLSGKLEEQRIREVLLGKSKPKPNRTPTVKVRRTVYAKYFKPNQSAKEVEEIVEKALEMYFEYQATL